MEAKLCISRMDLLLKLTRDTGYGKQLILLESLDSATWGRIVLWMKLEDSSSTRRLILKKMQLSLSVKMVSSRSLILTVALCSSSLITPKSLLPSLRKMKPLLSAWLLSLKKDMPLWELPLTPLRCVPVPLSEWVELMRSWARTPLWSVPTAEESLSYYFPIRLLSRLTSKSKNSVVTTVSAAVWSIWSAEMITPLLRSDKTEK